MQKEAIYWHKPTELMPVDDSVVLISLVTDKKVIANYDSDVFASYPFTYYKEEIKAWCYVPDYKEECDV